MRFTLPNLLTISRVPLMFIIVGLMYADFRGADTIAFWLFIVAALTDWLDGMIARKRGEVSSFGRFMDTVIDKVMVIDQSPIGRTPRSNPATYTGVFDIIREVFTETIEAKARRYKKACCA
jgi:phosphatidylglycerophosphate synthase